MYRCCNCGEDFYRPDEIEFIRTTCEMILDVCPFCKSENIEEVDNVWDPEVR